jgi:hypothetical protein
MVASRLIHPRKENCCGVKCRLIAASGHGSPKGALATRNPPTSMYQDGGLRLRLTPPLRADALDDALSATYVLQHLLKAGQLSAEHFRAG